MQELICIENEKAVSVKGAKKIISSTPTQTIIQTQSSLVIFSGSQMEVKKLDIENGEVALSGDIYNVKFSRKTEKQPLFKRIFK